MKTILLSVFTLILFTSDLHVSANVITQWTFNSVPSDSDTSTGTNVPSLGGGTATVIGGVTQGWALGSTNDPATAADDSGWRTSHYAGQEGDNKTAGVQFNVSTLGYSNIVVRWDQKVSSTASKYYRLQYSTDGSTFTDYPTPIVMNVVSSTDSYYEAQTNSLADITGVDNNFSFAFRIVSEFENTAIQSGYNGYVTTFGTNVYGTVGTARFDLVTVSGTPIPGANTPPSITSISNQTIRVHQSTGPLPFTIGDAEDAAASLTLNKTSSDPSVVPNGNVILGGSGSSRTVSVMSLSQTGTAVVTLTVIDTGARSNSTSFAVTVLPANTAPAITGIPVTSTLINTATAEIAFTINDFETPAANLALSGSSANTGLVPNGNIVFGGSGSGRTATVTPAAGQTGVAPITITVSDGTNSASSVFPLMVLPSPDALFYEPFGYPDGSILTNSAFLWANSSGTLGECQTAGGQLQVTSGQTEDVAGDLVGGPYVKNNGTVLYSSFKFKALDLPKTTPDYFAHFVGIGNRGRVYAGTSNAGADAFRLFVSNGSNTNALDMVPEDLLTNVSYTVITRYEIDTATTTLWLNPTAESDSSVTAGDSQSAITISSYGFRQSSGVGAVVLVDDLLVGLSFASVMPGGTGVTPIGLSAQRIGGQMVLSWADAAFGLQSAPTAAGGYTNVLGASSPFTNTISGTAQFFRLKAN